MSTGPGSSLLGTMTVDGGSERRERATGLLGSGLLVPTRVVSRAGHIFLSS